MMLKKDKLFVLSFAHSIVEKLWIMGLISDSEKAVIDAKNKVSFLSK